MSIEAINFVRLLPDELINSSEAHLLLALACRCNQGNKCWPSLDCLSFDTKMDRKTIIKSRQSLIGKGIIKYTGTMHGEQKQIPEMEIIINEQFITSTKNGTGEFITSTVFGTGTSTKFGTGTSTKNGTRKLKEEVKRGIEHTGRVFSEFFKTQNHAQQLLKAKENQNYPDGYQEDDKYLKACEFHIKARMKDNPDLTMEVCVRGLCKLASSGKLTFDAHLEIEKSKARNQEKIESTKAYLSSLGEDVTTTPMAQSNIRNIASLLSGIKK